MVKIITGGWAVDAEGNTHRLPVEEHEVADTWFEELYRAAQAIEEELNAKKSGKGKRTPNKAFPHACTLPTLALKARNKASPGAWLALI